MIFIKNKKAAGDFLVLILVGLLMTFIIFLMGIASGSDTQVEPPSFSHYYTKYIVRFLRMPASVISEEFVGMNVGEYISTNFGMFDDGFESFVIDYSQGFCGRYHEADVRGCYMEIIDLQCQEERLRSASSPSRVNDPGIVSAGDCLQRIPSRLSFGDRETTSFSFSGPGGRRYEIRVVVGR